MPTPLRFALRTLLGVSLAAAAIFPVGCATSGPRGAAPSPDTLRIGVSANMPPLVFLQNGEFRGLEADFARGLAAETGRRPVFVNLPFEDLVPALVEDRVDILMSGLSVTESRSFRVAFARPTMTVGQMALVHRRNYDRFLLAIPRRNVTFGVEKGTTGDLFVLQQFPEADRIAFRSPAEGVAAVASGKVDLFVHDAPFIWWEASAREADGLTFLPTFFTEEAIAWAVAKDDPELLAAANAYLARILQTGEYQEMVSRWIPTPR